MESHRQTFPSRRGYGSSSSIEKKDGKRLVHGDLVELLNQTRTIANVLISAQPSETESIPSPLPPPLLLHQLSIASSSPLVTSLDLLRRDVIRRRSGNIASSILVSIDNRL